MRLYNFDNAASKDIYNSIKEIDPEVIFHRYCSVKTDHHEPISFRVSGGSHGDLFFVDYTIEGSNFCSQMRDRDGRYFPKIMFGPGLKSQELIRETLYPMKYDPPPRKHWHKHQFLALGFDADYIDPKMRIAIEGKVPIDMKKEFGPYLFVLKHFAYYYMYCYCLIHGREQLEGGDYSDPMRHVNTMPKGDEDKTVIVYVNKEKLESLREDHSGRRHREHGVRGHWCYSKRGGDEVCDHTFLEVGRANKRQRCSKCNKLRWWRGTHKRGDADLGVITQSGYKVTIDK